MPLKVYVLERLDGNDNWEWDSVFDSRKVSIMQIFLQEMEREETEDPIYMTDIVQEGTCHSHPDLRIRVWEVNI